MPIIDLNDFDNGLWLLGGRDEIAPNCQRVNDGANPIRSKSMRSRNGIQNLFSANIISATRFYSHRYAVNASGQLLKDGVLEPALGARAGTPTVAASVVNTETITNGTVINYPAGTVSGDLLVLFVYLDSDQAKMTNGTPSGWTYVGTAHSSTNDAIGADLYYRTAGAETSVTLSSYNAVTGVSCQLLDIQITNGGGTPAYDASASSTVGAADTVAINATLPTLTTATNNELIIGFWTIGNLNANMSITAPASMTLVNSTNNAGTDTNPAITASATQIVAGALGTYTATFSTNAGARQDALWTVAVKTTAPAAVAATRGSFVKAPPKSGFGNNAFLFITGFNPPIKVDSTGAVTYWGIAPPLDGFTATAAAVVNNISIDTLTATAGWTATNCTLTVKTDGLDSSGNCLNVAIAPRTNAIISKTSSVNLNPASSSDNDPISFWLRIDNPHAVGTVVLQFDINSSYTKKYYSVAIPLKDFATVQQFNTPNNIADLDKLAASTLHTPANAPVSGYFNAKVQLGSEYVHQLEQYAVQHGHTLGFSLAGLAPNNTNRFNIFIPSSGAQQVLVGQALSITAGNDDWFFVQIPRSVFHKIDRTTPHVNDWANVTGYRFRFLNRHSSVTANIELNDLAFLGGVGMFGDYQYYVTFTNAAGTQSNPNLTPVTVAGVTRTGVSLASLPVSADPQVTGRTIWRTVGNGGFFYAVPNPSASATVPQLPTIADNTTTTFTDNSSDFFGYGPNDTTFNVLTFEPLMWTSIVPPTTITQAIYWNGTMFACGDTATGARGRIYYSVAGAAEGIAGYTDISNDDDPTTGFAIWGGQLYLFTNKQLWQIVNRSVNLLQPLFSAIPVTGAPGCNAPFSIQATPAGLIYQSPDGLLNLFTGYTAIPIAPQIGNLLRGESAEGYSAIGTIIASTYKHPEYIFSDGTQSFGVTIAPGNLVTPAAFVVRSIGLGVTALYFEPDTGNVQTGAPQWSLLEIVGQQSDNGSGSAVGIPFNFRTASAYSGEKFQYKVNRVIIDANTSTSTLNVNVSIDGTDIALGTMAQNGRGVQEFNVNQTGRVCGVYLTGPLATNSGIVEVFRIGLDVEPYGNVQP